MNCLMPVQGRERVDGVGRSVLQRELPAARHGGPGGGVGAPGLLPGGLPPLPSLRSHGRQAGGDGGGLWGLPSVLQEHHCVFLQMSKGL